MVKKKMKMKAAVTAATVRRLTARLKAHYSMEESHSHTQKRDRGGDETSTE